MFSTGASYGKLKTNLRLSVSRLKLLEKKKTELAQKARKEIADYIAAGKTERAKIRVEHIIREDYLVEAMEVVEMYCDLLLARFGLIQQMKNLDEGLAESISSLIWVAPRLQTDVAELKIVADQLASKYGKPYAQACRENGTGTVSEKLMHRLSVQAPPKVLVERYLIEIAKSHNVEYEPDPQVLGQTAEEALLINMDEPNDLNMGAQGGPPNPPGFMGFPFQPPYPSGGPPPPPPGPDHSREEKPFNYPPIVPNPSFNIPPAGEQDSNLQEELKKDLSDLPPPYTDVNLSVDEKPKPAPRTKFDTTPEFPELPTVPSTSPFPTNGNPSAPPDDVDFDELTKRFEELKKKK